MSTAVRTASPLGMPADTGFLLVPLAVGVLATAYSLAAVLGLTFPPVDPYCSPYRGVGSCSAEAARVFMATTNYFNLLILPGVYAYLWQTRLRRRRMRVFDTSTFPAAAEVIDRVLADVRPRDTVPVLMGPRLGRRAVTAGTGNKPYVAIGPELLTAAAKGAEGRDVLEAVLRHELAHVQNRDLIRYQLVTSLRTAFLVTSAVGMLLLTAELIWGERSVSSIAGVAARLAVTILAIELFVRSFLRTREMQADLRAAGDNPQLIQTALKARPTGAKLLDRLLRRHPDPVRRASHLDDLGASLSLSWAHALAGGMFLGLGLITVWTFTVTLTRDIDAPTWQRDLPILLLIGVPAALFLALGVWRDTWRACRLGTAARPWLAAIAFIAGLVGGSHLAGFRTFLDLDVIGIPLRSQVLWPLLACLLGFCYWLSALARRFFERDATAPRPPRNFLRTFLPIALAVGAGCLLLIWHMVLLLHHQTWLCDVAPKACVYPSVWRASWGISVVAFGHLWVAALLLLATLALASLARRVTVPKAVIWTVLAAAAFELTAIHVPALRNAVFFDGSAILPAWRYAGTAPIILSTLVVSLVVAGMVRGPAAGPIAALSAFTVSLIGWAGLVPDYLSSELGRRLMGELLGGFARDLLGQTQIVAVLLILLTLAAKVPATSLRRRLAETQ